MYCDEVILSSWSMALQTQSVQIKYCSSFYILEKNCSEWSLLARKNILYTIAIGVKSLALQERDNSASLETKSKRVFKCWGVLLEKY